jgi:hypothetical protein
MTTAAEYAALRAPLLTAASKRVPLASLAQQARALSLWDGKQVVPADEMQFAIVFDLGVLDPVGEHGRGIDRQARAEPPPPGSPEAKLLAALQVARFGLFTLHGPDPLGGVKAAGFPDGAPLRITDQFLGAAPPGILVGLRLVQPEADIALTCGTTVQVDSRLLERLLNDVPPERGPVFPGPPAPDDAVAIARLMAEPAARLRLADLQRQPGFAARVYRTAIDLGLLGPVQGRTPHESAMR